MVQGVVMIHSDLASGSLHAARAALSCGRWLAVPYPVDQDRKNNESKVQANLLLADGSVGDRRELLRLRDGRGLKRVFILRGDEDCVRRLLAESSLKYESRAPQDDRM